MFSRFRLLFFFVVGGLLWQPAQAASTVALVNAASYEAAVAPGSIAALFGSGFTTATQSASSLPLPTTLAAVSVKINGQTAPLFYASPTQINLQVPSATAVGTAMIEVFSTADATTPIGTGTVTVVAAAPGLFTYNASGKGQTAALNSDYSINAEFDAYPGARPEAAGNYAILYATGIGNTNPVVADGQPAPSTTLALGIGTTTVTVGGVAVQVAYSGLAPGFVGLWQINVLLPETLPTNFATTLHVHKNRASQETTLAVASKTAYSALTGKVTDALSGAALSNATVSLTPAGQAARTITTNAQGEFHLPVLRPGSYSMQAAAPGFLAETQAVTIANAQPVTTALSLSKQRPNIVLIVADDLGYADLGVQGSTDLRTPHIDSIAQNGARFTSGYVTAPVCSPSRAGLLTGRYQQRFGYELNPADNDRTYGLPTTETTMATHLKALGYATGAIGKWHQGAQTQFLPQARGFNEFFGFLQGQHSYTDWSAMPNNPILRGTTTVTEQTYLTEAFAREAADFVERNRSQPFFLYLTFNAPHAPLEAPAEYLARFAHITETNRRTFAAMMAALDDGVGRVLAKLREHQLEENTLLFFISDNGGPTRQTTSRNDPFSGAKDQLLEGGIRVPFFVQWKGYLPSGRVHSTPVNTLDILPSSLAAATGRHVTNPTLDGVSLIPYLAGVTTTAPHDKLYWRSGSTQYAIRVGDWKMLFLNNTTRLYNLATDSSESTNLATQQAARLSELRAAYEAWTAQLPPAP